MRARQFVFVCLIGCVACPRVGARLPVKFAPVATGISYATFDVPGAPRFSGHAFAVDLTRTQLRVVPAPSAAGHGRDLVDTIAAGNPAYVAINASFFDPAGDAMGRVVSGGVALEMKARPQWGTLVVTGAAASIVLGDTLAKDAPGGDVVVQGLPRLVVDGSVLKLKPQSAARTAVCVDGSTLTIVVSSEAETTEFARFLADAPRVGGLGCKNALNFDGGPSTQLSAHLGALHVTVPGGWGVPNALVVTPGAPATSAP